ncbi:MAG: VWA domain-containing protein [Vicinamibacterales bacterium]
MRVSLLVVAALTGAASAAAQPAPAQSAQTFRAGTEVVQVDVRVFKGDQFVTGLGPADFAVTEDGVPQKVESVVLVGAAPSAPSPPARPAPSAPAPSAPLAPSAASAPSVWLFLFDTDHLSPAGLQHTREAALQFLDTRWHQGDVGGVVSDGRMANKRLTSDRAEIRAAVAAVKTTGNPRALQIDLTQQWPRIQDEAELFRILDEDRPTIDLVSTRACTDDPDACKRVPPDDTIREKARRLGTELQQSSLKTLTTVKGLANGLARVGGPKTIVFFSEGFVIEQLLAPLREAVGDAARAGAHFYTIDARGLEGGHASSANLDAMQAESLIGRTVHFDEQSDGTNTLAVDTGGIAIRNENNFGRALDEIQRDAATYYVVGYAPVNTNFDGKYRAIDVKVDRPGVKVRARRGYLALASAKMLAPTPVTEARPDAAAPRGIGVPEIPVTAGIGSIGSAAPVSSAGPSNASAGPALNRRDISGLVLALKKFDSSDVAGADADRGWAAYQRGDVETATRDLTAAASSGSRPWVWYALGFSEYAQQHYAQAGDAWSRVKTAVPEFESVYFNLADAMSLLGNETGAIGVLRDAQRRWPNDAEVDDAIGVIEIRRSALDAAIESFRRAAEIAPGDAVGFFNLGRAHQMRWAKTQRYDPIMEKWVGGERDRDAAIDAYTKYVQLGGPYADQARKAIATLQWKK